MTAYAIHRQHHRWAIERAGLVRLLTIAIVLLFLFISVGCSSLAPASAPKEWRCQSEADAAVGRGDWKTGLALHQAFVRLAPDNCLAMYHLGYIWGQMGDRTKEAAQYERALKCGYDRDDRLLYNLGMAYGDLGRSLDAIGAFESAVRLNSANADNHFGLGLMHQAVGQDDQALAALSRVLSLDSRHWEARLALSRILIDQGRLKKARSHLEALVKTAPDKEAVRRLWRLYQQRSTMLYEP